MKVLKCRRIICLAWLLAAAGIIAGCSSGMPNVRANIFGHFRIGASPTINWYGSKTKIKTYWGEQDVSVSASAFIPQDCRKPEDVQWDAAAKNVEGKPIPFIGVVRKYRNENGTELAVLSPPINLARMHDCLYVAIDPRIEMADGKVKSMRPVALVCEIRDHAFMPFQMKVALIPESESELTPRPETMEDVPVGTPISVQQ